MKELAEIIAQPDTVTIGGKPVTIKKLTIGQLPTARELALTLFTGSAIQWGSEDYAIDLEGEHIAIMKQLIALMTDLSLPDIELPLTEFFQLFFAVIQFNGDFFLQIIRKTKIQPIGPTSSLNYADPV